MSHCNALPILEVDGHWPLADYLDEPDLAPRARDALAGAGHPRESAWPLTAPSASSPDSP
jgi:putative peptide zinc metalloprotease protein